MRKAIFTLLFVLVAAMAIAQETVPWVDRTPCDPGTQQCDNQQNP